MATLRASALLKAHRGETTYEEAARVTQADSTGSHACPSCSRAVTDEMQVCPWCGVVLDRGHCSNCGRELNPDWRICPYCRTPAPAGHHHTHPHGIPVQPRSG